MTKEEIWGKNVPGWKLSMTEKGYRNALSAMEEYAQQVMGWTTIKPDFKEECVLVTATKIKDYWEYNVWCIAKVKCEDSWYMGWLTGDGEEYGDLADLKADQYLILPKH
jgi:hypothetical protein